MMGANESQCFNGTGNRMLAQIKGAIKVKDESVDRSSHPPTSKI
jgi:hypothetical protein